jgi:hypothetical protein
MARALNAPHTASRIIVNNTTTPAFFRTALIASTIVICFVVLTVCRLSMTEQGATAGVDELLVTGNSEHFEQQQASMPQNSIKDKSTSLPRPMKLMEDNFPQSMNSDPSMIVLHSNGNAKGRAGKRGQSIIRKFKGLIGKNDGSSPAWSEDRLSISGNAMPRAGPSNHPSSKPIF